MFRVGVKSEASGRSTVVLENPESGYRRECETYEPKAGPWGPSSEAIQVARDEALVDAKDWVVKFIRAGIAADLVEFIQ